MYNFHGRIRWVRSEAGDDEKLTYTSLFYRGESMAQAALHFEEVVIEMLSKMDAGVYGEVVKVEKL